MIDRLKHQMKMHVLKLFAAVLCIFILNCGGGSIISPPVIGVTSSPPENGFTGIVRINGTVQPSSGLGITSVECFIDSEEIEPVNGLENWWVDIDTTHFTPGVHSFSIRAEDSSQRSSVLKINIDIKPVPGGNLNILRSLDETYVTDYMVISDDPGGLEAAQVVYYSSNESAVPVKVGGYVYKPSGDGPYPCIIYNHGGVEGNVNLNVLATLAGRGYAVFATNYQGHDTFSSGPQDLLGTEVYDSIAMLYIAKRMEFVDPANVYMVGESRGAAVTLLTLDRMGCTGIDNEIRGASVTSALYDLETAQQDGINSSEQASIEYFMDLKEITYAEALKELSRRSPGNAYNHDDIVTPLFIGHGMLDEDFPPFHSENLASDMESQGVNHELKLYSSLGHGLITYLEVLIDISLFWDTI